MSLIKMSPGIGDLFDLNYHRAVFIQDQWLHYA